MSRKKTKIISEKQFEKKQLKERNRLLHNKGVIEKAIEFQEYLRKSATKAEQKLAMVLSSSPLNKLYEFQHIIYIKKRGRIERFFIADFCFSDRKLIIELDGGYHYTEEQIRKDKERTSILKNRGYTILRIKNETILMAQSFDSLIKDLLNRIQHENKSKKK